MLSWRERVREQVSVWEFISLVCITALFADTKPLLCLINYVVVSMQQYCRNKND